MKKRDIYILLSHSGSVFSKAINLYTKEPYTHVSIALDKNLHEFYSFGRIKPYNPVLGGFVKEDIEGGSFKRFPNTICALYSLKITYKQFRMLKRELNKFKREGDKYGYNLIGVVSAAFNYPIHREYKYFCSQFVSELLLKSGIKIIDKNPSLTAPMDLIANDELECIYKGYLSNISILLSHST